MGKSLKVFQQEALGTWLERLQEAQCGEQTRGSKSGSRDQKSSKRLWWALPQCFSTEQSSQKISTKQVIYAKPKAPIHLLGTCRLRQAPPSGPLPTKHMELSEEMKEMGRAWAIHGPGGTGIWRKWTRYHAPGEADSVVYSYPFFSN